MKILKVIFTTIIFLAAIAIIFLAILYFKGNKEKKVLTDNERKGTSGQFIKLSSGITHYQLGGPDTGKVVILIHGFSVPYFIWDGTYEFLVKQGFRVLRYDMYGRGYSDRPTVVYNQDFYQTQLLDLIKQLHLKTPLSIAGISFGGEVVTDFGCKHPELISKVILIDPGYGDMAPSKPEFMTKYYMATHADEQATGQLTDFKYPQRHPDWVSKYIVQMQYEGFRNALVSTMYNYHHKGRESSACLNGTQKPILLIWGKEDHTVPFHYSDSVRSVLKCDFFPVDDAAHLPYIEQADKVNAKILEFLKDTNTLKPNITKATTNTLLKKSEDKQFKIGRTNPHLSDDDCVFKNGYTAAQRLKHYPFNKANKIVAVSYQSPYNDDTIKKRQDTVFNWGLHIKHGNLNYSSLKEIKVLNAIQINDLTNIIYNTTVRKPSDYAIPGRNCFNPRNALLFYDKNGKVFDYLEVCFECIHDESLSHKITTGNYCNQKYGLLKDFFVDLGIKYGTIKTD